MASFLSRTFLFSFLILKPRPRGDEVKESLTSGAEVALTVGASLCLAFGPWPLQSREAAAGGGRLPARPFPCR